jgi:hypothetical protein
MQLRKKTLKDDGKLGGLSSSCVIEKNNQG